MPFVPARIEIRSAAIGTGLKVALKRPKGAAARMSVSITGNAKQQLGWADGDKIEVLIGTDGDHGLMRLRKNNSVGQAVVSERKAVRGGAYLNIALGHQPDFVNRSESAAWCQWEVLDEGWVEVVLPKWADETGPKDMRAAARAPEPVRAPVAAAELSPVRRGPGRPPKNVTANIMGDPPAVRREMLARMGEMKP